MLAFLQLALASAALSLLASAAAADDWSGIRVYVGHPREAWSGTSDCDPCNRFCSDLRAYNRRLKALGGTGWRIGYSEVGGDGRANRIVILRAMDDEPTPTFVGVLRGVETGRRIEGYDPGTAARSLDAILRLDPIGTRPITPPPPAPGADAPQSRTVIRPSASAYQPHWTWPGNLKRHLAQSHGYPIDWLDQLSTDQLEALHDGDHDSGRVTPQGQQRWKASPPQVSRSGRTSQTRSAGMQVLGLPVYQQWQTRSACPGGICP